MAIKRLPDIRIWSLLFVNWIGLYIQMRIAFPRRFQYTISFYMYMEMMIEILLCFRILYLFLQVGNGIVMLNAG